MKKRKMGFVFGWKIERYKTEKLEIQSCINNIATGRANHILQLTAIFKINFTLFLLLIVQIIALIINFMGRLSYAFFSNFSFSFNIFSLSDSVKLKENLWFLRHYRYNLILKKYFWKEFILFYIYQ